MASINCQYYSLIDSQPLCQVVAELIDRPLAECHTNDSACTHCLSCGVAPQQPNVVTASMAIGAARRSQNPTLIRFTDRFKQFLNYEDSSGKMATVSSEGTRRRAPEDDEFSLNRAHVYAVSSSSDLSDNGGRLRELAARCELVVEIGTSLDVSTKALLSGQPARMLSISPRPPANFFELASIKGRTRMKYQAGNSLAVEIPDCDLLFISTKHTGQHLWAELLRHQAKATRFIVLSHTHTYGQRGEGGGLGLMRAVERLAKQFPRWRVISHHPAGQGLTVLSCRSEDFLTPSPQLWPAANGPGTELKRLLASVGVNPAPSCDCNGRARMMDQWGPAVCRQRIEEIVGWMREGQARWGWKEKLSATAKAVANGLVFKLNPLDPFPSLIEEAIRQSEIKQQQDAAITSEP